MTPFSLDFAPAVRRFGARAERVGILVDRQKELWTGQSQRSAWAVLPWLRGGELRWLLIANDAEGERRAREVIAAFVGPAVGSVEPGRLVLNSAEESQRILQEAGIEHVAVVQSEATDAALLEAFELMIAIRAAEPELRRDVAEPIGFLLRDFHLALSSGDPEASERLLGQIERTGLLARENLRFLRVERLAKIARWHELGALPWFGDLARSRRPRHVTEYLLQALWRREFDDVAVIAEPGAALRRFKERDLGTQFRSLVDAVDVPSSMEGRRLVWLATMASGNDARAERLTASVDESEWLVLEQLARAAPAPPEPPAELQPLERARSLLDSGDFVGAVGVAEESPEDPALIAVAVRAAFELSDADLASRAVGLVDRVGDESLPSTPGFIRNLRDVRHLAANRCSGWPAWFARVAADVPWAEAADVARSLSATWDSDELRQPATADAAANDLLLAADGVNALQVRAALDLICEMVSELAGAVGASSLADATLLILSMEENPSGQVRDAFFTLAVDIIRSGPSSTRYTDMVRTAQGLWDKVRAPETVGWALDLADALATFPTPDPEARRGFVTAVGTGVLEFAARLAAHERSLLEALAVECQTGIALPPTPLGGVDEDRLDVWESLSGKVVGLYSLLEGAGARFKTRMLELNPSVLVEHNADKVATESLRHLARQADFLIVDTRHATHSATGGIDEVRPRDEQLFPAGGGLSSFLSRLREALEAVSTQVSA